MANDDLYIAHNERTKRYRKPLLLTILASGMVGGIAFGFYSTPLGDRFPWVGRGLIALSALALIAAGLMLYRWRGRLDFISPQPRTRAALTWQEKEAASWRGFVIRLCFPAFFQAFIISSRDDLPAGITIVLAVGGLCFCWALLAFVLAPKQVTSSRGVADEFADAMRARAIKIGFVTAMAIIAALGIAAPFVGPQIVRALPIAFALAAATPALAFVWLTRGSNRDE